MFVDTLCIFFKTFSTKRFQGSVWEELLNMTALVRCWNGIQTLEKTWPFYLVKKASGGPSFKAPQPGCSQEAPLSQNTRRRLEYINKDCFSDSVKSKRQIETAFTRMGMTSIFVSLLTFIQCTKGLLCRQMELCKNNWRADRYFIKSQLFVLIPNNDILTGTAFTGLLCSRVLLSKIYK